VAHELLDDLLRALAEADGSDLHVKVGSPPRIRVNGDLRRVDNAPQVTPELTAEMAGAIMRADVAEMFEAKNDADFAYAVPHLGRFRVNAFRQRGTVGMIFRRVRTGAASFEELGLPEVVARLSQEQRGLVLVTGPTGSGKTTTLAAMIDFINDNRECHIVTIEDPIEVLHRDKMASINQREVGFDTDNFANAMRAAMRQDPDVILVGDGKGRVAALEVMVANGRIQNCIIEPGRGGDVHEIIADGEYYGMQTFDQSLAKLYERGAVDMRGAMSAASNPHDLKVMLQQRGLVSSTSR
jgi:Tfp pilus assembly pilus retraction ATPase PilT